MTRPRPPATRLRVLRWLLVLATLAGLGLGPGGHCAEPLVTAVTAIQDDHPAGNAHEPAAAVRFVAGSRLAPPSGVTVFSATPLWATRTRPVPAVVLDRIGVCRT